MDGQRDQYRNREGEGVLKSGLVALLTGESSIRGIVGQRVYVGKAPQKGGSFPHIVITQQDSGEYQTLDGSTGTRSVEFDIDCKAERSVEVDDLSDAVRRFIDDYTGPAGKQTVSAVIINSESMGYETPADGSDVGVHATLIDCTIFYNPT